MRCSVTGMNDTLRRIRKRTRWSQSELGDKIGISQTTIARWESSNERIQRVDTKSVEKIRRVCGDEGIHCTLLVI